MHARRAPFHPRSPRLVVWATLAAATACTPAGYRRDADEQVYRILEVATERVTGEAKVFDVERPVDTLRRRLLERHEKVRLDLLSSLDVAAENSREFQRQKELLYLAALSLTREQWNFSLRFTGGGSAELDGVGDDSLDLTLSQDLSASANSTSGTRVVASFVNTFLRSLMRGGGFDGSSILSLTLTQPLLRAAGRRVVREPLTQAERDVIYQVRAFERERRRLAVRVISDYYGVVEQIQNLESERANLVNVRQNRERSEALFEAGRLNINGLDQARQNELTAEARVVRAENTVDSLLDRFKLTLGLPTDAAVELDVDELRRLRERGIEEVALDEDRAIRIALQRRYDYRTAVDQVEDAARRVLVAEDALQSSLDFSAMLTVPTEPNRPFKMDWEKVRWSAGFDLQLALDKLPERNAYRQALISLDAAIRAREQLEDQVKSDVRQALRNIRTTLESYRIQANALRLAERRVDSTREMFQANRVTQRDVNEAQDALLAAQIALNGALVDYAIARLELLRDLEAIALEPKGLRFDPALPLPSEALSSAGDPSHNRAADPSKRNR